MPHLLYSTYPDQECAEKIAHLLVSSQLVACANLFPAGISIYRWQDKIEQHAEVAMLCKTTESKLDAAIALIREHHPYDVPAILNWPASGGNPAFLGWVAESVGEL